MVTVTVRVTVVVQSSILNLRIPPGADRGGQVEPRDDIRHRCRMVGKMIENYLIRITTFIK